MRIAISSGHSEQDQGSYNPYTDKYEFYYVKRMEPFLIRGLQEYGLTVYSPDEQTDGLGYPDHLVQTCDLINAQDVDAAIELHCNAFFNEGASGSEILAHSTDDRLANLILEEWGYAFGDQFKNRGVKVPTKRKAFLTDIDAHSLILEPVFLTNTADYKKIDETHELYAWGMSIALAIKRYFSPEVY